MHFILSLTYAYVCVCLSVCLSVCTQFVCDDPRIERMSYTIGIQTKRKEITKIFMMILD